MSGLKVNFHKSSLLGVNVDDYFRSAAASFLFYSIGKFPFKFLGLPIGANPRRASTWQPIIDVMRKKLASRKGKNYLWEAELYCPILPYQACRFTISVSLKNPGKSSKLWLAFRELFYGPIRKMFIR